MYIKTDNTLSKWIKIRIKELIFRISRINIDIKKLNLSYPNEKTDNIRFLDKNSDNFLRLYFSL